MVRPQVGVVGTYASLQGVEFNFLVPRLAAGVSHEGGQGGFVDDFTAHHGVAQLNRRKSVLVFAQAHLSYRVGSTVFHEGEGIHPYPIAGFSHQGASVSNGQSQGTGSLTGLDPRRNVL